MSEEDITLRSVRVKTDITINGSKVRISARLARLLHVTRVPDDTMAQNGDLALALNLASDGDGLKMLEKPMPMFQLRQGETVLCVHQNDGYKHYITSYDGKLWWGTTH